MRCKENNYGRTCEAMQITIEPNKKYKGTISAPVSKSVAHRLLIAAALGRNEVTINGKLLGDDIAATAECLQAMGCYIAFEENSVKVSPLKINSKAILNVNESGSTLRFLLPIVCALGIESEFVCAGRLIERPLAPLLNVMEAKGAVIKNSPLRVSGKLQSGSYDIDGTISSQFISGLLFALPLLSGDSNINIKGIPVSQSYIDITLSVLSSCGIEIAKTDNGYFIKGNQKYNMIREVNAEGDWSSCAFFAVLGALSGDISILNLDINSKQGDKAIIDLLKRAKAKIAYIDGGFKCKKSKLHAIEFSAENIPDLVPIVSIALASAKGISKITQVDRLKDKESDRLFAVMAMLTNFGVKCHYEKNALYIAGGTLTGGEIDGYSDHRIVMSAAIGACLAIGSSTISDRESINKSYPQFFEDLESVGGSYE